MRRRILVAILVTTAFALVLFGLPLGVALARGDMDEATIRLEREATLAVRAVPADFATSNDPVELTRSAGLKLALYDAKGRRIVGDGPRVEDLFVRDARRNRVRTGEQNEALVAAVPVSADERVVGVIRAERSLQAVDARVTRRWFILGAFGLGVLALSALIGHVLADRIARRVRQIRDDAVELGDGNLTISPRDTGIKELDEVAGALHTTAGHLRQTLERERSFSADASHQLRTPLTGLRLLIDNELAVSRDLPRTVLTEALVEVDRLEATIDSLLQLARSSVGVERPTLDVDCVLRDVSEQWRPVLAAATRPLRVVSSVSVRPRARHAAIVQALVVLIENASRHGRGAVTIEACDVAYGIAITVTDEGPGIIGSEDTIFRRHETGAADAGGTGIGLALARSLVEGEGGRLVLERARPGARFAILLPTDVPPMKAATMS